MEVSDGVGDFKTEGKKGYKIMRDCHKVVRYGGEVMELLDILRYTICDGGYII